MKYTITDHNGQPLEVSGPEGLDQAVLDEAQALLNRLSGRHEELERVFLHVWDRMLGSHIAKRDVDANTAFHWFCLGADYQEQIGENRKK